MDIEHPASGGGIAPTARPDDGGIRARAVVEGARTCPDRVPPHVDHAITAYLNMLGEFGSVDLTKLAERMGIERTKLSRWMSTWRPEIDRRLAIINRRTADKLSHYATKAIDRLGQSQEADTRRGDDAARSLMQAWQKSQGTDGQSSTAPITLNIGIVGQSGTAIKLEGVQGVATEGQKEDLKPTTIIDIDDV